MKNSVKDIGNSVKNGYNYVTNHLDEMNAMIPVINLGSVIEYIQNNLIDKLMSIVEQLCLLYIIFHPLC